MGRLSATRHQTLLRAAAAAAAALALALAAAPERAEAAKPGFHGVAVLENPSFAEMQRMSRGGVKIVRLPVYWHLVEHTPGARDWTRYDALFGATGAAGLEVLAHLNVSPPWLYTNQSRPPIERPEHLAAWSTFVRDFSARYGPGGLFWKLNPLIPARPVWAYQLWNEPNLKFFWGGKPNAKAYMRLMRGTRAGLDLGSPGAKIVTGGLFREPRRGTGVPAVKYLNQLYNQKGAKRLIDAVGLHPYAGKPRGVIDAIGDARRVMKRRKDRKAPVWVTEFGWAVAGLGLKGSPVKAKPKSQAKRLKQAFRLMQKRRNLRVKRAFWFSWRDFGSSREFWIYRMGLFDLAGNARPAWYAYARSAGGTP